MKNYQKYYLPILLVLLSFNMSGQLEDIDEKFTNYYKEPVNYLDDNIEIYIKNIASRYNYFKFAFKIKNVSKDYIVYDNAKSKMVFDWGEATMVKSKDYFLKPKKTESEVFDVSGDTRFLRKKATMHIDGLVKVPKKGSAVEISDWDISTKSAYDSDGISVEIKKKDIKLKKSTVSFRIKNDSENYVVLYPSQLKIQVFDDKIMENDVSEKKVLFIRPGKSKTVVFSFDLMENQEYVDYTSKKVKFGKFMEISKPEKLPAIELNFEIDREITFKMNK